MRFVGYSRTLGNNSVEPTVSVRIQSPFGDVQARVLRNLALPPLGVLGDRISGPAHAEPEDQKAHS